MKNFKSGNRSRNREDSPRRNSGGGDSRRFSLHDAVCNECGKDCQVPFKPSGEKPIYCSNCFEKRGGKDGSRSSRRSSRKRDFGSRDPGRSPQSNISNRRILQLTEKIGILNTKLETIINLLSSTASQPKTESKVEEKPHPVDKSKSKQKPQPDKAVDPDNESSVDQNTEKKEEFQLEAKAPPEENSRKPITKS